LTVSSWDLTIFATVPWQYFDLLINEKTSNTEVPRLGEFFHRQPLRRLSGGLDDVCKI